MAASNTLKILETRPNFSKTKHFKRKLIPVPKSRDQDLSSKQHLFWDWSVPLTCFGSLCWFGSGDYSTVLGVFLYGDVILFHGRCLYFHERYTCFHGKATRFYGETRFLRRSYVLLIPLWATVRFKQIVCILHR